ncbi:MAG: hypothetical protein IPH76_12055 [Xanthomonadales bacterium]|nr:hypothetical protein [Xanthomonadales bacterium]
MARSVSAMLLSLAFATAAPSVAAEPWVAVYHPLYQWSEVPPAAVPWNSITHLIVGYLLPEEGPPGNFTVAPPNWYGDAAFASEAAAYSAAGAAAGRVVTCMLGGDGSNPGNVWNNATTPARVAAFAANIKAVVQPLGCTGVDLDWENGVDYAALVRLAQALRTAWPQAVITIPTAFTGEDAAALAPAAAAVDAFMPMTYIAVPQWGGWTLPSPLTPLYVVGANSNSIDTVRGRWQAAGVPTSKLVMGSAASVWFGATATPTTSRRSLRIRVTAAVRRRASGKASPPTTRSRSRGSAKRCPSTRERSPRSGTKRRRSPTGAPLRPRSRSPSMISTACSGAIARPLRTSA